MPRWALIVPLLAIALLGAAFVWPGGTALLVLAGLALIGAVQAAVHHAEVVAHRVGEPFGTLVLAVAITVIEVALIVSMMLAGGADKAALPRDTIFAAVMIICNGVVGLCLLVGGLRHHEQSFRIEGANSALAALIALSTLSLVLPTFTTSSPGGTYTVGATRVRGDRVARAVGGLRVRADGAPPRLLPAAGGARRRGRARRAADDAPGAGRASACCWCRWWPSSASPRCCRRASKRAVDAAGAPKAVIGIAIALLVLLPETWAAVRAARADRLQTSLNLALRLGAGEHRPDDPGGRGRLGAGSTCRWCSASSRRTWCCSTLTFLVSVDHAGQRPHAHDAGRRAPGDLRGVPVPRARALSRRVTVQRSAGSRC